MIIRTLELVPYLFWTKNWNIKLDTLAVLFKIIIFAAHKLNTT